jgi:stress response protein YsnF
MAQPAHRLDDDRAPATIPVVEERAVVRKRKRLTGGVRVRTVVREDERLVDAPLRAERVEVKRVPLDDRWVEAPVPVRQEGDTTVVTLHEEVVVVETRLRATEEIHLVRRQATRSTRKRVTLRREEAVVERLDVADGEADPA